MNMPTPVKTPTPEQLEYIDSIKHQRRYGKDERNKLYATYNEIFQTKIVSSTCGSCIAKRHKQLINLLK
tara:strand:- start:105 stop:311 length:207 start_codon:yes stop_codon:yes gene_type:complete